MNTIKHHSTRHCRGWLLALALLLSASGVTAQDSTAIAAALVERLATSSESAADPASRLEAAREVDRALKNGVSFSPEQIEVRRMQRRLAVTASRRILYMLDQTRSDKRDARWIRDVIEHHQVSRAYFIGKGSARLTILLNEGETRLDLASHYGLVVAGKALEDSIESEELEQCHEFDPSELRFIHSCAGYSIRHGDTDVAQLGDHRDQAVAALVLIRLYGLDRICSRPQSDEPSAGRTETFSYLR